jgi:dTDP-4-dehydrorhamnose reductase
MDDTAIFIVGAKGQLGLALQAQYPGAQSADIDELDITNVASVNNFNWDGIQVILNAAAYTNVDGAETDEGRIVAWNVNATAVANLASVALKRDIAVVHFSSDYVFDGTKNPHTETETLSPLSVYGQSKAAGDLVISTLPKYYLIRTSWVIGEGKNFVRTMLELAKKQINPTVVADQVGRLTFTSELVRAVDHLLSSKIPYGIYNLTDSGEPASWADIARTTFSQAGYDNLVVTDTTTEEYFATKSDVAPRPLNSVMDLQKIEQTGFQPIDWHDDLSTYIKKELAQ